MSSHVRKMFSQTMLYGLGSFLNRSLAIILLPVYTAYFSVSELGYYALLSSVWFILIVIFLYGSETSFLKFFIGEKDLEVKKKIYSSILLTITITSFIFSIIIFVFASYIATFIGFDNESYGTYIVRILSVLLFTDSMYRIPLILLRAELNAKKYFQLTIVTFSLNLFFNLVFIFYFKLGIEAILLSYIISVAVTYVISLYNTKEFLCFNFDMQIIKNMVVYGNKFIYVGLIMIFIEQADRFFLKHYFDEGLVGIYSANFKLASVMSLLVAAYRFSWTPYFLNIADNPENKKIIAEIFTYFVFAGVSLVLIFSLLIPPIVKLQIFGISFLHQDFWYGLKIVPIVLLSYFFAGLFANMNVAPFFANKTYYLLITALTGVGIYLFANITLIPKYDITGAALSSLITYVVMFFILYFISQRIYRVEYKWYINLSIMFIAACCFLLWTMISYFTDGEMVKFVSSVILIAIYFMTIHFSGLLDLRKGIALIGRNKAL